MTGNEKVRNPGPLAVSGATKGIFTALIVVGAIAFGMALQSDARRAWYSYVLNHFYFMSLAVGGLFFAAIQWATGAMWSAPVRRISEAFTAYIPVALVTFVLMYFGMKHIYIWTDAAHVAKEQVLQGKSGYLNITFFMVRNVVFLAVMAFFARKMIGNSLAQDSNGSYHFTARNKSLAPGCLIAFGILYTMSSFDTLMSLDPTWFSTMFGVYCFSGLFYSVLALTTVVTVRLKRSGALAGIVNDNHLHDLGKFMFAFTIFYAYIGFSQFMLIWYANLPEETGYFMNRFHGSWWYVSVFLLVGKFMTPFFLLLPRDAKRSERMLMGVGLFMLVANWIDVFWMSQPELFRDGPVFGWIEAGTTLGFIGVFGLTVSLFLSKNNIVAIGDPRLAEAVFHHHQ
jgi:hypothetical protein